MTTSGTYNFSLNKTQIIARSFQMIGKYDINTTISSDDYSFAGDILNAMFKMWSIEGIHLWKRREATLFPILNQYSYQLGSVSGADRAVTSYVSTTVATAVTSSSSTIVVASATGLAIGMNVGLELDNNSRQWGTISNVVGTTLTVSFSTTTTAAVGNTLVSYSTSALINRPLLVNRMTNVDLKNNNQESTMQKIGQDEYFDLPVKNLATEKANNFYYDRLINNSLSYTGTLYLFPSPSITSTLYNFTYVDEIQDMTNQTDTMDLPQEWTYPVMVNLAAELAQWYGTEVTLLQTLQNKAQQLKQIIMDFDGDDEPLTILPDQNNYYFSSGI